MRAALDVALAKPEPAPPQTVALAGRLRTELDQIERLLEAFLVLARAQHRSMPGQAVLPLDYIVGAALADQAAAIRAMDLTVQDTSSQGGAWVAGSQALLSRMVENVIDNAVCHNTRAAGSPSRPRPAGARLVVENGGQLLDQQQVAELSQPFRRLEADRIGTDKGSGLGLSIVAAIAEAHGGTLDLRARPGGGLRVCVDLPAAAATTSAASLRSAGRGCWSSRTRGRWPRSCGGPPGPGMAVDAATTGCRAAKLDLNSYDVVVLDRDLPGIHGDALCQMITDRDDPAARRPPAPPSRTPPSARHPPAGLLSCSTPQPDGATSSWPIRDRYRDQHPASVPQRSARPRRRPASCGFTDRRAPAVCRRVAPPLRIWFDLLRGPAAVPATGSHGDTRLSSGS